MKLFVLVVALWPVFAAEDVEREGIRCPGWMKNFAARKDLSEGGTKYWHCPGEGQQAVLRSCPEGMVYKAKHHICRTTAASQRLSKRSGQVGAGQVKDVELLELEALGLAQELGAVYNAKTESFVPGTTFWNDKTILDNKVTQDKAYSHVDVYTEQNIQDRAYHLNVEASITLGFMSGLIQVQGSAKYLQDAKDSSDIARVVMSYKSTRKAETIPATTPGVIVKICKQALQDDGPTHVVTSLVRGLRAFMTFDKRVTGSESVEEIGGRLKVSIDSIPGFKFSGEAWIDINGKEVKNDETVKVQYNGDTTVNSPTSYLAAIDAFKEIQEAAPGATTPVRYHLTPLTYLCTDDIMAVAEIGDNLVNQAIKSLVELETLGQETQALLDSDVSNSIDTVRNTLNTFKNGLDRFVRQFKIDVKTMLEAMKKGQGSEAEFALKIEGYEKSPYQYDRGHLFLQQRKRQISTIQLIYDESRERKGSGGEDIFTLSDENECLLTIDFIYTFKLYVLPTIDAATKYIDTGVIPDESHLWYNNADLVGAVGGSLKDFLNFGEATWPKTESGDPKHCFMVQLYQVGEGKSYEITYDYSNKGHQPRSGAFKVPVEPPTPVCTPLYDGFDLATASADNDDVTMHWVEAIEADVGENDTAQAEVSRDNLGTATTVSIHGLEANTKFQLTTKYKVLEDNQQAFYRDLGFSGKSAQVECFTAPTTPVQNLRVTEATASSLRITWTKPAQPQNPAYTVKYILKVRTPGAEDSDSMIKELAYTATTFNIAGLDPSTLYEILLHTESEVAEGVPVLIKFSTAPLGIPYPEVTRVGETDFELTEKLGLLRLAEGLAPQKLIVGVVEVDQVTGANIGAKQTINVALGGSSADKRFTVSNRVGGKSYSVTIILEVRYGNLVTRSLETSPLIVTTSFGGTPVEKVQQEFDQIKDNTDRRIDGLDGQVNSLGAKVTQLDNDLDSFLADALPKITKVESEAAGNYTSQEQIFIAAGKKACFEPGQMFYGTAVGSTTYNLGTPQECLVKCRQNSNCKAAVAKLTSHSGDHKYSCALRTKRTGSYSSKFKDDKSIGINRVCYDALSKPVSKWSSCKQASRWNTSGTIKSATAGFTSVYDCMLWCLRENDCQAVSFQNNGACHLKSGTSVSSNGSYSSMSLSCLMS